MHFIWKFLALIAVYALVFVVPIIQGEAESSSRFEAVFIGMFLAVFLFVIFGGFFVMKKILSVAGVRVLSSGGDIIKTDLGHSFGNVLLRGIVNLAGDTVLNLVFVLYLIFFAVASASLASEVAQTV